MQPAKSIPVDIHYQWLDWLRFVAALFVVLNHARNFLFGSYGELVPQSRGLATAAFYAFTRLGAEAVIVFFVLSGYLVGGKAIERMLKGSFDPTNYAIDRLTRIWIPLIPALGLSSVVWAIAGHKDGLLIWIGNLLGLQGAFVPVLGHNGPLWSLAYEIWFYVLTYAVGRQVMRKSIDVLGLILIAVSALIFSRLAVQFLACWLIGALFYLKPLRLRLRTGFAIAALLCAVAVAGLQFTDKGFMAIVSESPALQASFEILLAIGTGVLCATLVSTRSTRFSSAAAPFAAFSYTLYLTHFPLLLALESLGWKRVIQLDIRAGAVYVVVVAACLLLAWMMYYLFERNTSRIRSSIKRMLVRPITSSAASA